MYNNIDFYVLHEGQRLLIARRYSRMFGRGMFQWMKPWHVVDAMRKNPDAKLEQEGDFMPHINSFGELAETLDRDNKLRADTARVRMAFIRWCADRWGTFYGDAERCLQVMSDASLLDWLRQSPYRQVASN